MTAVRVVRIMHVVDLPGANAWLNGIGDHYDRRRFHHSVVSLGSRSGLHESLADHGVAAFALGAAGRAGYPAATARLCSLLRREQVDIVQTHLFYPSLVGLAAASMARTPVQLVTRHHSDFTTTYGRPVHRQVDRLQARWADGVLAASAAVKRDMVSLERVPESKITVAPYGYDFDQLRPRLSGDERRQLRHDLGGDSRVILCTVARLSDEKGHRYLFEAARELVRVDPRLLVVLAGTGPLRAPLEQQVRQLGLEDHVRFLGWRGDATAVMEASDLVVHPSLHEAFCSVIIEAMALERPLVATRVAAAPEQVDDGVSGLLVPAQDAGALVAAVTRLLGEPAWGAALGAEARRRVVARFNFPLMMARYEEIYEAALARAGAAAAAAGRGPAT